MSTKAELSKLTSEKLEKLFLDPKTKVGDKSIISAILAERDGSDKKDTKKGLKPTSKKAAPKKADQKSQPKKAAPKKVGVIASIYEKITKVASTEVQILSFLKKRFPEKNPDSLANTIKAQIGTKKRPVRMEREKDITLDITENAKGNRVYFYKA